MSRGKKPSAPAAKKAQIVEPDKPKIVVPRDERGRILPGHTLNIKGFIGPRQQLSKEIITLLNDHYSDDVIVQRLEETWAQAVELRGVKTMMAWLEFVITWRAGGKLPTRHIRVNTKFEDMLAALGSDEPVTIDGEVTEGGE